MHDMRRMCAAAATGVALFLLSGVSSAQAPALDSVTGGGGQAGNFTFSFDAHSGPSGENPSGRIGWHSGGGLGPTTNGDVTCLSVNGNIAVIGFSGAVSGIVSYWVAGLIRVVDAGGPETGGDTFEWAELRGEPGPTPVGDPLPGPTDCSAYPGPFPFLSGLVSVGTSGDIAVVDAPNLPTSKDQCKNGGWRNYGVFKNQGACVSFVRHHARLP
jgi:hypothetical protein